ncbi:MAG: hypothetical protein R3Y63_09770 [Eubacteriales bacterium]
MSSSKNSPERKEKLIEISLYQTSATAYKMVLLAVATEMYYVITVLGNIEINYLVGAITMLNIAILFMLFTIAIKVNVYSDLWTKIGFGLSGYLALRSGVLLPAIVKPYASLTAIYASSILTFALLFFGCITSSQKIKMYNQAKAGVKS